MEEQDVKPMDQLGFDPITDELRGRLIASLDGGDAETVISWARSAIIDYMSVTLLANGQMKVKTEGNQLFFSVVNNDEG